jgi:hypothetical protein
MAAMGGHLELLQWAVEHGCPYNSIMLPHFAVAMGHLEIADWVQQQGL